MLQILYFTLVLPMLERRVRKRTSSFRLSFSFMSRGRSIFFFSIIFSLLGGVLEGYRLPSPMPSCLPTTIRPILVLLLCIRDVGGSLPTLLEVQLHLCRPSVRKALRDWCIFCGESLRGMISSCLLCEIYYGILYALLLRSTTGCVTRSGTEEVLYRTPLRV